MAIGQSAIAREGLYYKGTQGILGDDGHVHYLDWGNDFTGVYTCHTH